LLHAAVFTIIILKRRLFLHHWQGLMLIGVGAFVVGLSSVLQSKCPPPTRHHHIHPHHDYPDYDAVTLDPVSDYPLDGRTGVLEEMTDLLYSTGSLLGGSSRGAAHNSKCTEAPRNVVFGNLLVLAAQVFAALQFVIEEKYVKHYRVPALLAVGLEGFWGLILSCVYLPLFQNLQV
jgi:drug/metabolite transporter (DMT)-like permease